MMHLYHLRDDACLVFSVSPLAARIVCSVHLQLESARHVGTLRTNPRRPRLHPYTRLPVESHYILLIYLSEFSCHSLHYTLPFLLKDTFVQRDTLKCM